MKDKFLIHFKTFNIAEQLNAKYRYILNEAKQNYVDVLSDEMSARKALQFKEKEERGEIQRKEKDIISRQPQVPYEPYHPGLMIEAQNPQLNEGISRNFNELKKSTTSQGPPRSYLKYPNFIIPPQNVIPEFQNVRQAPARQFTEPKTSENELLYTPTPSPENIILMPKQRVSPEQLSIFNNPSHRPIHPEIASIIQHPPRRPIEVPSQQPESNQSPYIYSTTSFYFFYSTTAYTISTDILTNFTYKCSTTATTTTTATTNSTTISSSANKRNTNRNKCIK